MELSELKDQVEVQSCLRWQKAVLKNFNTAMGVATREGIKNGAINPLKVAGVVVVKAIEELFDKKNIPMSYPARWSCSSLLTAIKKAELDHAGRCHDPFVCVDGVKIGCNQSKWNFVIKTMEQE